MEPNKKSGFTLIEVLFAFVIMMVLVAGVYRLAFSLSEDFKPEYIRLTDTYPLVPSYVASQDAKLIQLAFVNDLENQARAYVIGGQGFNPSNTSLVGLPLKSVGSAASSYTGLSLPLFPNNCYDFAQAISAKFPSYTNAERVYPEAEFSVVFLSSVNTVHSIYTVLKSSGVYKSQSYNVYEVKLESADFNYVERTYSMAVLASDDALVKPVGAQHRWHRYDPKWGITEQDSVFVVFPDPLLTPQKIDHNAASLSRVSRFTYEIPL